MSTLPRTSSLSLRQVSVEDGRYETHVDHQQIDLFGRTRGQIVMLVRRAKHTVEDLARALGLTDNSVRAHLAVLERDGIMRQRGVVRRGSGKPACVYGLTPQAEELFPKAYGPVLGGRDTLNY